MDMESNTARIYAMLRTAYYTTASRALAAARAYPGEWYKFKAPAYPRILYNPADKDGARWVEHVEPCLRAGKYADQVLDRLNHRGWYTNEFGDEVLRGHVYQLPARKGKPCYVAGYDDPNNPGAARIDFSTVWDDESDAARAADSFAERQAEEEREYNEAWHDGARYSDLCEEIKEDRKEILALLSEYRAACRAAYNQTFPILAANFMQTLHARIKEWREKREKKAEKWADYEHLQNPRNAWRAHLWSAFCDGAGIRA